MALLLVGWLVGYNGASPLSENYALCTNPAVIVDTSLLKAYIKAKESLAIYFIRAKNYCHVNECAKELTARGKLLELVQLYRSKGLHQEALALIHEYVWIACTNCAVVDELGPTLIH
jgi:hypothetical protein